MLTAFFYVVAMSLGPEGGLYRYEWGPAEWQKTHFYPAPACLWVTFTPDGRRAYAAGRDPKTKRGEIRTFAADPTGHLTLEQLFPLTSSGACHLAVSPDGRFLYGANYSDGTVTEIVLKEPFGVPEREARTLRWQGKSVDPVRQKGSHPHQCTFSPDGKFLLVCDLGLDEVRSFPFEPGRGVDETNVIRNAVKPAGAGPRHLVFSPDGKFVYLATEMGHTLVSLKYHDGKLDQLEALSTLPEEWILPDTTAACRRSPEGRFIAVTDRGHDSVALFEVKEGKLRRHLITATGAGPRDGNFLPGGKFYATANEKDNSVTLFRYEAESGNLIPADLLWRHPNPLQIVWPGQK